MITEDLELIGNWFRNNLLVLNGNKTKIVFFNTNRDEFKTFPDIYLNGSKIAAVNEIKYLGLIIDSNLAWNEHIKSLIKKVNPYIGVFRRISFICGDDVKKMLYYAYFYSNITYLLTVWSGTKKENIGKLEIIQNKCIRNLFFNVYKSGKVFTEWLYKKHNILEFKKIIELELNTHMYKIMNKKLKCNISRFGIQ